MRVSINAAINEKMILMPICKVKVSKLIVLMTAVATMKLKITTPIISDILLSKMINSLSFLLSILAVGMAMALEIIEMGKALTTEFLTL